MINASTLLKSFTAWGLLAILIPFLDELIAHIGALPTQAIPRDAQLGIQGMGLILAAYGWYCEHRKTEGNAPK